MSRGTDTSSLSLVAELLSDLNLETLAGGERLNTLDSMSLQGNSSTSLTLSNTVASHLSATLHNDSQQRPLDAWSPKSTSSPPTQLPTVFNSYSDHGSGG